MIPLILLFLLNFVQSQELLTNERCNHYPERGTCETSFEIKWYYDRFDHRCRRFFYGGCDGNANRFDTMTECETTCHFDTAIDDSSEKRCFQPHDPGQCWGNFERWVFDANLGRCICSWWSGCGGNSNRFFSYPHCMQICGAHVKSSNKNVDVYESPVARPFRPLQPTQQPEHVPPKVESSERPTPFTLPRTAHVFAKPRDTLPLGGSVLYPNHVSTPQHPPIYDDPDLFNIEVASEFQPDNRDDSLEDGYEPKEWPINEVIVASDKNTAELTTKTEIHVFPANRSEEIAKDEALIEPLHETTHDVNDMLLNLKPPSESIEGSIVKRTAVEVVETPFRTLRKGRKTSASEGFETPMVKTPQANYERYDTPFVRSDQSQRPPDLGYAQTAQRSQPRGNEARRSRTRYHEYAETPFIQQTYFNPRPLPGSYPILRTVDPQNQQTVPVPVPQELVEQLIAQHKALLARQGARRYHEVRETSFRRPSGRTHMVSVQAKPKMTYAEKRRLWKEAMKKRLRKPKIPPRPMQRSGPLFVTYSPHNGVYQVSRLPPSEFNQTRETTTTTEAPTTTTTMAPPSTTAASTTPKTIKLKAEPIPVEQRRYQIRVSAVKPTSDTPVKQLVYMDDYDDINSFEDDQSDVDVGDSVTTTLPPTRPRPPPRPTTPPPPPSNGLFPIVFPSGQRPLPTQPQYIDLSADKDYTDYGHSEEDLFFLKPDYEQRNRASASRVIPSNAITDTDDNDFEITVHNPT